MKIRGLIWLDKIIDKLATKPCFVALNSALGFIKPLPIKAQPLNQCDPLDQPNSDL